MAGKSKPPKSTARLRLYICPRSSPQYLDVVVHPKPASMWRARGNNQAPFAFFAPDTSGTTRVGELHFSRPQLTFGLIAHEIFHAVTFWADQIGCPVGSNYAVKEKHYPTEAVNRQDYEEVCAEVMGSLMGQMVVAAKRHGLLKLNSSQEGLYFR